MTNRAQTKKLDLASLKASTKPFRLELKHPVTKEPLGQFIDVLGSDSQAFQDYNDEIYDGALLRNAENSKRGVDTPPKGRAEQRAEGVLLLVAVTTGFDSIEYNGPLPYTHANVVKLYTEMPWIKQQVDEAVFDRKNFIPG